MIPLRSAALALSASALLIASPSAGAEHVAFTPGAGPIPQGAGNPGDPGYGLSLTLSCNTTTAAAIQEVVLSVNLTAARAGAMRIALFYTPQGGTPSSVFIIDRIGAATPASAGDMGPMSGAYVFIDNTANIWTAAATTPDTSPVPSGVYSARFRTAAGAHFPNNLGGTAGAFGGKPGRGTWTLQVDKKWNTGTNDTFNGASISITHVPATCLGDLNNDRVINVADLTIFLGQFGQSCP